MLLRETDDDVHTSVELPVFGVYHSAILLRIQYVLFCCIDNENVANLHLYVIPFCFLGTL